MTGCVFFFEHKTAYELRISDWSSDVCSSDLHDFNARVRVPGGFRLTNSAGERRWNTASGRAAFISHDVPTDLPDRKSVVQGQSVSVRVDLGGRSNITKKKTHTSTHKLS